MQQQRLIGTLQNPARFNIGDVNSEVHSAASASDTGVIPIVYLATCGAGDNPPDKPNGGETNPGFAAKLPPNKVAPIIGHPSCTTTIPARTASPAGSRSGRPPSRGGGYDSPNGGGTPRGNGPPPTGGGPPNPNGGPPAGGPPGDPDGSPNAGSSRDNSHPRMPDGPPPDDDDGDDDDSSSSSSSSDNKDRKKKKKKKDRQKRRKQTQIQGKGCYQNTINS